MKTRLLLFGCLLSAVAVIGMYVLTPSTGSPQPVRTAPGERGSGGAPRSESDGTAVGRIAGIGFIEPESENRRLVFPVDGVIGQCLIQVGDRARCGQTLMALRNYKEKAAVDLARREIDLAQADRKKILAGTERNELEAARRQCDLATEKQRHAKKERERYALLRRSSAASQQAFDQSESTFKQADLQLLGDEARLHHLEQIVRPEDIALADARVAVAREKIEVAQRALDDTFLRAPIDGTVLEILKREGDGTRVLDGQPSIIFADMSRLRVRAEIDERQVHLLSASMPAVITGRALGFREFQGKVVRVNRIMGPKTVFARVADERRDLDVVQVLIEIGPGFNFPVGLRVDVFLRAGRQDRPL